MPKVFELGVDNALGAITNLALTPLQVGEVLVSSNQEGYGYTEMMGTLAAVETFTGWLLKCILVSVLLWRH